MNTIRSGFCMTESGALIYGWGEDLTANTLGIAMNAAGCVYGIHLDMNPYHTSYIYYRFKELIGDRRPEFEAELAMKEMLFSPNRYVNGAPKDFFFLTLKDIAPGPGWNASGLAQPAPAFVPAVFKREVNSCKLVAIDLTRTSVEFAPGEIPANLAPAGTIMASKGGEELIVDMSLGPWSSTRGQLVDGTVVASLNPGQATLGIEKSGALQVGMWPLVSGENGSVTDAVQARWLKSDALPNHNVTALGFRGDQWIIIGSGQRSKLAIAMEEQGVFEAIVFPASDDISAVAIRGEQGMMDLNGAPISARDTKTTALRVFARPKPLGMTRLEKAFGTQAAPQPGLENEK